MPVGRPRGVKAAGLRYEKELARAIPTAVHGQWFEFQDSAGPGHCQPDLLLETAWGWAVLEAKYTWTQLGHQQVEKLYRPVVERAWKAPTFGLVVCKVLTVEVARSAICRDLSSALFQAASGRPTVLHWIGNQAALGPPCRVSRPAHLVSALAEL